LEANWTSTWGVGKAGVGVGSFRDVMNLSLKKSSIVCLKFSLINFSFSSINNFFFKMPAKPFACLKVRFRRHIFSRTVIRTNTF